MGKEFFIGDILDDKEITSRFDSFDLIVVGTAYQYSTAFEFVRNGGTNDIKVIGHIDCERVERKDKGCVIAT